MKKKSDQKYDSIAMLSACLLMVTFAAGMLILLSEVRDCWHRQETLELARKLSVHTERENFLLLQMIQDRIKAILQDSSHLPDPEVCKQLLNSINKTNLSDSVSYLNELQRCMKRDHSYSNSGVILVRDLTDEIGED